MCCEILVGVCELVKWGILLRDGCYEMCTRRLHFTREEQPQPQVRPPVTLRAILNVHGFGGEDCTAARTPQMHQVSKIN